MAVVAESEQDLSKFLYRMDEVLNEEYNTRLNTAKTKVLSKYERSEVWN